MLRNEELKAYSLRWPGAAFPICRSAGLSLRSNGPPELAKKMTFLNEFVGSAQVTAASLRNAGDQLRPIKRCDDLAAEAQKCPIRSRRCVKRRSNGLTIGRAALF